MSAEQVRSFIVIVLLVLLSSIIIGYVLITYLQRIISDPLLKFKAAVDEVRVSKNFDLSVPVTSHDELGQLIRGFNDMMASDRQLVARLIGRGARAILCAGNGLSAEAFALALHGFDVTALDISSIAAAAQHATLVDGPQRLAGLTVHEDGTIVFPPDPVDAQYVPPIHRAENSHPRGGGSLRHGVGDLCDPTVCPGPFDVVIERRTVQLFPAAEQAAALARLTDRLAPRGYFITHQHKGAWRPPEPRAHFAEEWLASTNFVREGIEFPDAPRVAKLWFTTG